VRSAPTSRPTRQRVREREESAWGGLAPTGAGARAGLGLMGWLRPKWLFLFLWIFQLLFYFIFFRVFNSNSNQVSNSN
jgi:hypothetical protein